ncbi:hypothetical protein HMPREF0322_03783 [Desulfitobacterium hafniense DP7]|uniref:Uncharacterized protein n=1 Tax=Desulfitobacterium hafniense DP7 TaxID=537010 RepID=G9XS35_DESHA|nr:hypothetical protein HMPREF0322_03783 [Desulfitobacterium hafniense DP7]
MRPKDWIVISLAGLYIIAFIILRVFFTGAFDGNSRSGLLANFNHLYTIYKIRR